MNVCIGIEISQIYLNHRWLVFRIDDGKLTCYGGYDDYNSALLHCNCANGIIITRDKVRK